jgi:nicotinamide riboside transporter PnuC
MRVEPISEQGAQEERLREPRGIAALWFALMAGPVAWFLGLIVQYSLVRVECAKGGTVVLHLVTFATLALSLAGAAVAWREWKRTGRRWPGEEGGALGRSRFMVALGLLGCGLFSLTIVAQWVAGLFLNPCMGI